MGVLVFCSVSVMLRFVVNSFYNDGSVVWVDATSGVLKYLHEIWINAMNGKD